MGRVAIAKMVILPRCMYGFQHSFDKIPRMIFKQLNSTITSLIWAGKRCRVARSTLFLPLTQGGLAVPDLEQYYFTSQLQHATRWMYDGDNWEKRLLEGGIINTTLPQILMAGGRSVTTLPYLIKYTAQIWERTVRVVIKRAPFSRDLVFWDLPAFKILWESANMKKWKGGGV